MTNPDSGSATEELEVEYASDPLDIGFNSRYLLDIAGQLEAKTRCCVSPTRARRRWCRTRRRGALYVLMPMRV